MSTTRARWPALLGALLALGCGPDPVERVTGVWEVDADALVDDPLLTRAGESRAGALAADLARGMVARVQIEIAPPTCTWTVAGRADARRCSVRRDDDRRVVLRVEAPEGPPDFWHLHLGEGSPVLEVGDRRLPLRPAPRP
ncbi:MAG: hypothetical protein H6704_30365 [Myxococcales bacterium]|nr:hypothetical protein [Myxococcales bacterium]